MRELLFIRKDDMKHRAFPFFRLHEYFTRMILHDLPAKGKTDARAGEIGDRIQSLEDDKYFIRIFLIKSDAVIGNGNIKIIQIFFKQRIGRQVFYA